MLFMINRSLLVIAVVASEAVILEPDAQLGFSIVLRGLGRSTISSRCGCNEDISAESLWTSGSGVGLQLRSSLLS
jgi:hypothetical protein